MAIERTPGLLDDADALGHHHQAGRRRDDARGRERQRIARQVRLRRAAGSRPDRRRRRARRPGPATSTPPPQPSIWLRRFPARASSTRPRCSMPRRSVSSDASRSDAPANSRAIRHQVSGVWISRDPSVACPSPQQLRPAVAQHLHLRAGNGDLGERPDGVDRVQEGRFAARQLGRQAQLDLAAVAQAGSDQHALGQQPGSAIEHGGRAACPHVEAGRVDHQHRRPVAAQELPPGEIDRFAGAAAFGEARLLHALQPLQGRQGLGLGEARQRAGEGRAPAARRPPGPPRLRRATRAACVWRSLMAPPYPHPAARRRGSGRNARGADPAASLATPKERQPVTHFVTQAGCSPASTRSMQ